MFSESELVKFCGEWSLPRGVVLALSGGVPGIDAELLADLRLCVLGYYLRVKAAARVLIERVPDWRKDPFWAEAEEFWRRVIGITFSRIEGL